MGSGEQTRIRPAALRIPEVLLATGFGVGLAPRAPGTVGSLVALPIWWWLFADLPLVVSVAVLLALTAIGSWIIDRACRKTGVGDAGSIVLDEFVGVWIALLPVPKTALGVAAGFVLFRVFDIAKPWPVSWADQRVGGGFGIMLDDVFAGILAAIVLWVAIVAVGEGVFLWPDV